MSKLDIINTEIKRRESSNIDLIKGKTELAAAVEQFNKLDEMYRTDEKDSRELLECLYKENRRYTGKWPIVYSFALTEFYPFYNGETDAQCNPYFPITKVKDGSFDGLEPFPSPATKTGDHGRDRNYSPTEDGPRGTGITVLVAFPDTSDETGTGTCVGETPPGSGTTESLCISNGGTWTPPFYLPGDTATEKLRAALDPWRADIVSIMADLCNDTSGDEAVFWQDILDNIDTVLAAVQVDVTYPTQTQDFTPGSPEDIARDYLLAENPNFTTHINNRSAFLIGEAGAEEELFFGIIKLRLHQANGSYAKLKAAKGQQDNTNSIIADNNAAIKSLNVLKVKNS